MDSHKKKYENTLSKRYFNSIFNLDYKKIEPWIPRDYPEQSIKEFYKLNYLFNSKVQLRPEKKGLYNLNRIRNYNIFYNFYFGLSKERKYNDYFFNFIILCGNKELFRISNRGSDIIDFRKKIYEDETYIYYPICLFECFEKKFICIDDFDEPIQINIQHIINNTNAHDIRIKDLSIIVNCSSIKNNKHKYSEFYFNEIQHIYSRGQSFIPANHMRINDEYIFIDINHLCYTLHIGLWNEQYQPIPIKSIDILFDDYQIGWNSSKIIGNNNTNIHYIEFFPDTDGDFIKKNNVYGLNMNNIGTLALKIIFKNSTIKLRNCKIFIGIGTIHFLTYNTNL